jgi:hypothetical protein
VLHLYTVDPNFACVDHSQRGVWMQCQLQKEISGKEIQDYQRTGPTYQEERANQEQTETNIE